MIAKIANGENIINLPIVTPTQYPILVNESVAKNLNIKIPENLNISE